MVFGSLPKGSQACSYLYEILTFAIKCKDIIEEKGRLELEYVNEISSLTSALEEEQEHHTSLEERLESLDESNDLIISKIIEERDHAITKYKVLKKEKVEFGVGNARLIKDVERLEKAHRALESEHSLLTKSHDQLQTQLSKSVVPSSSTSSCNHVNIIEENARLNDELTKLLSPSSNVNDDCATNSTSCEASILKENVELRAQLVLLTSKYG